MLITKENLVHLMPHPSQTKLEGGGGEGRREENIAI